MKDENFEYPFDESNVEEVKQSTEDDYSELPPKDIIAFNELRSCADIFRMYKADQLEIQPYFQREVVWSKPSQTRFIDSLIKQLPIPSMCFSFDFESDERYVIDGLQRIQTIINFLSKDEWKLSKLEDIDKKISGKSVKQIKKDYPLYFSRVQNLSIPITVIRCNHNDKKHLDYLFTIFHRLNSGGSKLNNQEIRNCIYNGSLNKFLKTSVKHTSYKKLFAIKSEKKYRFSFEELNLRFIALSHKYEKYNGKLSKWLNDFMYRNRNINEVKIDKLEKEFEEVIDIILKRVFLNKPVGSISKAIIEGVYVGVQRNLSELRKTDNKLNNKYKQLREDENFSSEALKEGVAQKNKVIKRLTRAVEIFSQT